MEGSLRCLNRAGGTFNLPLGGGTPLRRGYGANVVLGRVIVPTKEAPPLIEKIQDVR